MGKGKCALIGAECPETNDRTKRRYCPQWKVGIPSVDPKMGFMAHPTFTGCFLDVEPSYHVATARDAAHSAAAFNEARDVVQRQAGAVNDDAQLMTMGLVVLGGFLRQQRLLAAAQSTAAEGLLTEGAEGAVS